jgi:pyridoxine 4-dehydrogenase
VAGEHSSRPDGAALLLTRVLRFQPTGTRQVPGVFDSCQPVGEMPAFCNDTEAAGRASWCQEQRGERRQIKRGADMSEAKSVHAGMAGTIDVGGDLTVNRLGFGAMRLTGDGIWGQPADREEAKAVLRRAVELGVNFIDTADSYGPHVSEELISETLHPYPDDLVIATKGGLVRTGPGQWPVDGRPEHLIQACEDSLRRLKLDQIPLYQFHRPDPSVPLEDSIGALVTLKNHGKIRHIGLSNVTEGQLRHAQRLTPIVSIQNRYNLDDRRSESLIDLCEQEQMVFLPWAPIQGLDGRVVPQLARRYQATPRQIMLAWLLARSPRMLPIPGTASVSHLDDNIAAAAIELTSGEIAALNNNAG